VADALRAGLTDFTRTRSITIVAAGKAAWPMAAAFTRHALVTVRGGLVAGPRPRSEAGGQRLPANVEWFDGGHPFPNEASDRAGRRALALAAGDERSTLVVLLSGGASAMLATPADGITLDDKVRTARCLMKAGISIDALNCVRKHLSAIKGGQLAASAMDSLTLAISDVHGPVADDPSVIGSGPTVADPTTYGEALAILQAVDSDAAADVPRAVLRRLERGGRGDVPETPKPGDVRLMRSRYHVIANRLTAMEGAAVAARALGYRVHVLPDATAGEARLSGERFARSAAVLAKEWGAPLCVIASGEPTVRVHGRGQGGRNQEFALGMAMALAEDRSERPLVAASAGTDGIDGPTDAAGAFSDSDTLARARMAGLDPDDALARNDTYPLFQALGDLIQWGPTGTNVGDIHVVLTPLTRDPSRVTSPPSL
jgi:glycerate 2-kinase